MQIIDFNIEIERYRDKDSGELITFSELSEDDDFEYIKELLTLKVKGYTKLVSSNLEKLFSSIEIVSINDYNGNDWHDLLSRSELESIEQLIIDHVLYRLAESV